MPEQFLIPDDRLSRWVSYVDLPVGDELLRAFDAMAAELLAARGRTAWLEREVADAAVILRNMNAHIDLLQADKLEIAGPLVALRELADGWATQGNDYDGDAEQQIADGRALLAILERPFEDTDEPTTQENEIHA
ncbi:hypothetical protein [Nocardia sp. NBC_01327]|uniref:hypothetical protein n=1 Tax=Nocardia sp. NBC_01327 TaxID=2903593 RepID=UPI002E0EB429|nr:hypothetical protein OG326_24155 [Nocardia sp. NBC_01327]